MEKKAPKVKEVQEATRVLKETEEPREKKEEKVNPEMMEVPVPEENKVQLDPEEKKGIRVPWVHLEEEVPKVLQGNKDHLVTLMEKDMVEVEEEEEGMMMTETPKEKEGKIAIEAIHGIAAKAREDVATILKERIEIVTRETAVKTTKVNEEIWIATRKAKKVVEEKIPATVVNTAVVAAKEKSLEEVTNEEVAERSPETMMINEVGTLEVTVKMNPIKEEEIAKGRILEDVTMIRVVLIKSLEMMMAITVKEEIESEVDAATKKILEEKEKTWIRTLANKEIWTIREAVKVGKEETWEAIKAIWEAAIWNLLKAIWAIWEEAKAVWATWVLAKVMTWDPNKKEAKARKEMETKAKDLVKNPTIETTIRDPEKKEEA